MYFTDLNNYGVTLHISSQQIWNHENPHHLADAIYKDQFPVQERTRPEKYFQLESAAGVNFEHRLGSLHLFVFKARHREHLDRSTDAYSDISVTENPVFDATMTTPREDAVHKACLLNVLSKPYPNDGEYTH